jgi:hypothetical protein
MSEEELQSFLDNCDLSDDTASTVIAIDNGVTYDGEYYDPSYVERIKCHLESIGEDPNNSHSLILALKLFKDTAHGSDRSSDMSNERHIATGEDHKMEEETPKEEHKRLLEEADRLLKRATFNAIGGKKPGYEPKFQEKIKNIHGIIRKGVGTHPECDLGQMTSEELKKAIGILTMMCNRRNGRSSV